MTAVGIGSALLAEVATATPDETVHKIKRAAAGELAKVDPTATIRFTDYFNHTFAPDIVLRWTAPTPSERHVYIRLSDDPRELTADVEHVREQHPMLVTLTPPRHQGDDAVRSEHLGEVAQEHDTLVSDLGGLDALGEARSRNTFVSLLSATVARGGRGLLNHDVAEDAAASIEAGFEGAQALDPLAVSGAAESALRLLEPSQAGRLNRFLQAVWLGAGGRADEYPTDVAVGGELDDESWNFLLTLGSLDDLKFWRRLGRGLTVAQLSRLKVPQDSRNFHDLVRANADRLWVRSCVLRDEQPNLLSKDAEDQWRWTVEQAALALRGPEFICFLAEKKTGLDRVTGTELAGVSVSDLRSRAAGRKVTSVVMSDGHDYLDLTNGEGQDVTQSTWLSLLSKEKSGLKIQKGTALLASGHTVNLDFAHSTASVWTRSQPTLPIFVRGVVPLLRDLDAADAEALGACFGAATESDLLAFIDVDIDHATAVVDE